MILGIRLPSTTVTNGFSYLKIVKKFDYYASMAYFNHSCETEAYDHL